MALSNDGGRMTDVGSQIAETRIPSFEFKIGQLSSRPKLFNLQ